MPATKERYRVDTTDKRFVIVFRGDRPICYMARGFLMEKEKTNEQRREAESVAREIVDALNGREGGL